ncbi:tryptophan 7-halogenase [Sphingomonas parva]|uniref:Tryptophan 7-halogenase n=1 Tax=Sphingomonas parva TaxID=2555898 RepID=A0A4Y8ZR32_9SPHN|nr:tryptophan halogenase family protein [Sphingomonas parva]TFI58488.1 tryptophan 7-halogenase [Sphingomonas parva]
MADGAVRSIVIVGGGTAGWMAAAAFARFLGPPFDIRLVESDEIGTVGVGEATIPQIRLFNDGLGIDEDEFLRATQGTFKLGIAFDGWRAPGQSYIHAFGSIGRPLGLIAFHHYWLRARAEGAAEGLWDYSPSALAANANRFARPNESGLPSGIAYAFHFDASLYAAYLRSYAEARGARRIEGRIADVARRGEDGFVEAVTLAGGQRIEGDFFVDCSGFRSLLLGEALETGFEDWSRWLPCDRALAVPCAPVRPLTPCTRATAKAAGWQWRIPLQHRTGNGYVYSSRHVSDDEAEATLLAGLDGEALAEPRRLRFVAGRRREAWRGNCVALGLAAGFLEPLESTSIHLVQAGIARLLQLLPGGAIDPSYAAEFNRQTAREWESIRDFLILHYHANGRDEPLWRACREMEIPASLTEKIALFRAGGRIFRTEEELFTEVGWLQVMLGQGIDPVSYHPLADRLAPEQLREFLSLASSHAGHVAGRMVDHADYVAQRCAAAPRR